VSKLGALEHLGLALSEKQIPQIVENTKKRGELEEPLEPDGMRPRQVRYQAALRPDRYSSLNSKTLSNHTSDSSLLQPKTLIQADSAGSGFAEHVDGVDEAHLA
jgi:hypothetical protein